MKANPAPCGTSCLLLHSSRWSSITGNLRSFQPQLQAANVTKWQRVSDTWYSGLQDWLLVRWNAGADASTPAHLRMQPLPFFNADHSLEGKAEVFAMHKQGRQAISPLACPHFICGHSSRRWHKGGLHI